MPGVHRSFWTVALTGEAGHEGSATGLSVPLSEPSAVLAELHVAEDGEIDVEGGGKGHQRAVARHQGVGEMEVLSKERELVVGDDLRAAAHGIEQPVLLRRVADQQVHLAGGSGGCRGQRAAGQDATSGDGTVYHGVVVAVPGERVLSVVIDDPIGGGDQRVRSGGHQGIGRAGDRRLHQQLSGWSQQRARSNSKGSRRYGL